MKVRKLVKELRKIKDNKRILIVAVDGEGREFCLTWEFRDDGPDWEEFSFQIRDGASRALDTEAAKLILNYAYTDPENSVSLFGKGPRILDYNLRVVWPCDRNFKNGAAWSASDVEKISFRKKDGITEMVLEVDELPPWKDEDYDQEEEDRLRTERKRIVDDFYKKLDAEMHKLYESSSEGEDEDVQGCSNGRTDEGCSDCG